MLTFAFLLSLQSDNFPTTLMNIVNLIVHSIDKQADAGKASLHLRQEKVAANSQLELFFEDLNKSFNSKAAKVYGQFVVPEGEDDTPFQGWLKNYLASPDSFVDFSHRCMDFLKSLMDKNGKTRGGYVVFVHYKLFGTDFLFIVILHNISGIAVDDALELNDTQYLDTNKLHLAARIDLSEWQEAENSRYISMIVGRESKKLTDYFRDFIGFDETVDSKQETGNLLGAVNQFCDNPSFSDEQKSEIKKKAVDYCAMQADSGSSVMVKDFSDYVSEAVEEDFYRHIQNENYELTPEVTPDRLTLRKYNKFSGRAGNLSISFASDMLNDNIHYNSDSDTLTIENIPKSLRAQLLAYFEKQQQEN